jgi:riboflavin synthase alpha subunit
MSNNKQQTAVEWYSQQIVDKQNGNGDSRSLDEIFEQAKEIEKVQMIQFARNYMRYIYDKGVVTVDEFYEQTYGRDKQ